MIELQDTGIENALAFQVSGKVTEDDMNLVLALAKELIDRYGRIVILEKILSFDGVEMKALIEEFSYLKHVGLSDIAKVAIVTDKRWVTRIASLEDKLFSSIDIQCFALRDENAAIDFLKDH